MPPYARVPLLALLAKGPLNTLHGEFQVCVFHDGQDESIALCLGDIDGASGVLCRIQSECISSHVFFGTICDCREQMASSMEMIREARRGVIIYLRQEGRGNGAAAHVATLALRRERVSQSEAYALCGFAEDARRYEIAAKVLEHLNVKSVRLISGNTGKREALAKHNVPVLEMLHHSGNIVYLADSLWPKLDAIAAGRAVSPVPPAGTQQRVLVIGDLNVDFLIPRIAQGAILDKPEPRMGGTALNAAVAFRDAGYLPLIFGKVGADDHGKQIRNELQRLNIMTLLGIHPTKSTGTCSILFFEDSQRWMMQDRDNANDYDIQNIEQAVTLARLDANDLVFVVAHVFFRYGSSYAKDFFRILASTKARLVLDLVPHNLYKDVDLADLNDSIGTELTCVIGEFSTLMNFAGCNPHYDEPSDDDYPRILDAFRTQYAICRFGIGNISKQSVFRRHKGNLEFKELGTDTGYEQTPDDAKRGFGDRLTANILRKLRP